MVVIDLGNDLACDTTGPTSTCPAGLLEDASGLDVPDFELSVIENSVGDGGRIGGTRTPARRMVLPIDHGGSWSRFDIMRAFTPNVERTISTLRGSMPYQVEALMFPKGMQDSLQRFTVSIVSPLAYPEGPLQELTVEGTGLNYATTTVSSNMIPYVFPQKLGNAGSEPFGAVETFETFVVPVDGALANAGIWAAGFLGAYATATSTARLYVTSGGKPTGSPLYSRTRSFSGTGDYQMLDPDAPIALTAGTYAVACEVAWTGGIPNWIRFERDPAAGHAGGAGGYLAANGTWTLGDGTDTTVDLKHTVTIGQPAAATSNLYFEGTTEVPTPAIVEVSMDAPASSLIISDGVHTTTITGSLATNDVVIIDSATRTVTVNGVNRLAWFDRDGDWPMVYPGLTALTFTPAISAAVSWKPRLMGLI